jgi:hypothetical protein
MDRRDLLAWAIGLVSIHPNGPHGLPAQRIVAIDREVRARFEYEQPVAHPAWDFSPAVEAHQPWRGNCVNLAWTTLSMLERSGSPRDTLYVLLVLDAQHAGLHAVGLADDDLGRQWIVGDTFSPAYPYAAMRHKLVRQYRYGG